MEIGMETRADQSWKDLLISYPWFWHGSTFLGPLQYTPAAIKPVQVLEPGLTLDKGEKCSLLPGAPMGQAALDHEELCRTAMVLCCPFIVRAMFLNFFWVCLPLVCERLRGISLPLKVKKRIQNSVAVNAKAKAKYKILMDLIYIFGSGGN